VYWETIRFKLVRKFPAIYGTRTFITALQVPAICPYPGRARCIPSPHIPLPEHLFIIILPSTPGYLHLPLSFRFLHQNPLYASPFHDTRYMPRSSNSSRFYHRDTKIKIQNRNAIYDRTCTHPLYTTGHAHTPYIRQDMHTPPIYDRTCTHPLYTTGHAHTPYIRQDMHTPPIYDRTCAHPLYTTGHAHTPYIRQDMHTPPIDLRQNSLRFARF
jgi:hypothetical protein